MLLEQTTTYSTATLGVGSVADGMAMVLVDGVARLIYVDAGTNQAHSMQIEGVTGAGSGFVTESAVTPPEMEPMQPGSGLAFHAQGAQTRMFVLGGPGSALSSSLIGTNGVPGAAAPVATSSGTLTGVVSMTLIDAATDIAALSFWGKAGIKLYQVANSGFLTYTAALADTAKSYLADVSDTASLTLDGFDYLLILSPLEGGINSFNVTADGRAVLVDALGSHDGLSMTGPAAMQMVQKAGVSYAVIAATGSSSLSVVRINDLGCLFTTDHVIDDLTTRFAHPTALDAFTYLGRAFIVTGGTDAGISFYEMMPGGTLELFSTLVLETGQGIGSITSIEIAVSGDWADMFVVDAGAGSIVEFEFSLTNLGGQINAAGGVANGSAKGDLILGSAANDTLRGNQGDDFIHDGGGADALFGNAGKDVFVFGLDTGTETIGDFELHTDRIDVSDWGRFYTVDALKITATANGAEIAFGTNKVLVTTANGASLTAANFTEVDFIF